MVLAVIVALLLALVGWVGGFCYGYLLGIRDTEERWAEAVGRGSNG